jgi:murein DD-endopeptidase / murein LD-carboxypeptidase
MIWVAGNAQTTHKSYPVASKPTHTKAVEKTTTTRKKAPSKKTVASKKSSKKKPATPKVEKPCVNDFYAGYCLKPDSAMSPYLYYQVYDWIGTRYKYSGSSKKGIDCSGFVSEMYRNTYCIALNGSSGSIYTQVKPIEKAELKEGDILFFKIRKKQISHVGVYLGNNKFAHASVHSGVIVSDLNEEYYKKYFFKGGRFLSE